MPQASARHTFCSGVAIAIATFAMLGAPPGGAGAAEDEDLHGDSRIAQGYRIAPVHLNLQGKNRGLVGLGSYLVNAVGGCNDCHTNPPYAVGGDPYKGQQKQVNAAGYLAGGTSFGPFVSRNLTPDKAGLPAGLTLMQFTKVIRTGLDPDGFHPQVSPFLQVMPWPVYQGMTDRDIKAIYEYISTIPCVEGDPGNPAQVIPPRC